MKSEKKCGCSERNAERKRFEQSDVAKEKETLREISTTEKKVLDHLLV